MARIRTIKPEVMSDPKAAALCSDAWRLWVCMWMLADDTGHVPADPVWLNGQVFWKAPKNIPALLGELSKSGRVVVYESSTGEILCHITNFKKHQRIDKPGPARYEPLGETSRRFDDPSTSLPGTFLVGLGKGREGKGEESTGEDPKPDLPHAGARAMGKDSFLSAWTGPEARLPTGAAMNLEARQGLLDDLAQARELDDEYPSDEVLCAQWRLVIDGYQRIGITMPATPAKMREHLGTLERLCRGEVTLDEITATRPGASNGHYHPSSPNGNGTSPQSYHRRLPKKQVYRDED